MALLFHPPYEVEWRPVAGQHIRRMDRQAAGRVIEAIGRFANSGSGDVKALQGRFAGGYRLRAGDYRILFVLDQNVISIFAVRHRSEAYR